MLSDIVANNMEAWIKEGITKAAEMLEPVYKQNVIPAIIEGLKEKLTVRMIVCVVFVFFVFYGYNYKKSKKSAKNIGEFIEDISSLIKM